MPKQKRTILLIDSDPADRSRWLEDLRLDNLFNWSIVEAGRVTDLALNRSEGRGDCILTVSAAGPDRSLVALRDMMGNDCPPIIVIAETDDEAVMASLIESGAQECLDRRTISPAGLHGAINRVIERTARQRLLYDRRLQIEEQQLLLEARQVEL